jgi:hypothetical protein
MLLLTLVHELGHAIAVRLRGLPLKSIVVGDSNDLTLRVGAVTVQLGRALDDGDVGGYVLFEATRASARDVMLVALAGPFANLAVASIFAALALAGATGGALDGCLWPLSVVSVAIAVGNLIPRGRPGSSDPLSDGRLVQLAWKRRRTPVRDWTDVPTPPEPAAPCTPASPEPTNGFRWPFKAALLLVAVVTVAAAGVVALLPLVVLFGGVSLNGAHRRKLW